MNDKTRAQVEDLFHRAVELDLLERGRFLDRACAGDPDLRAAVQRLLDHDSPGTDSIRRAVGEATTEFLEIDVEAPERIGPYRVIQRIGAGGMGEVYQVEQEKPIRRRLALKVIRPGMDTREVVARFESERQALALMSHTCIAKVFDAGTTGQGRPYFAMEYVAGEPLTTYCDRNRLTIRERIDIFLQVCDGVQHAHQKGIIHRDLKPSNILVTVENDRPVPKIIDFGVAKATTQPLTDRPAHTLLGMGIGTPEYMSPEQVRQTGQDIDTRTDVYSLGVILYELLTGALPFESAELRSGGFEGLRRKICEEEPLVPSRRFGTLGDASEETARVRRTEGEALRRLLRREPDWIVMKAMDKDRTRRYGSPDELAADLRRYLGHEPVLAGPPTPLYRASKFVRRHRAGVSMGTAVALALVIGTITTSIGMVRAQMAERAALTEARTSREVVDFLVELFRESGPTASRGEKVTAREVLERGTRQIHATLSGQPVVQARLLHTIGLVYQELGLHGDAEKALEDSLAIRREELGEEHADTLASLSDLALLYFKLRRYEEAEPMQQEAYNRRREILGEEDPATLESLERLALLDKAARRVEQAEARFEQAMEARRRTQGDDHPDTLNLLTQAAWFYWTSGGSERARMLAREAVEGSVRTLGEDHPRTLDALMVLASMTEGEEESEQLYERALAGRRRILGDDHLTTLNTAYQLAVTYWKTGREQASRELLVSTVEHARRNGAVDDFWTGVFENTLALAYSRSGAHQAAVALLRDLVERTRRSPEDQYAGVYTQNLATVLRNAGRLAEAVETYEELIDSSRRADEPGRVAFLKRELGELRELQNRPAEAERLYREAISLQESKHGKEPMPLLRYKLRLAGCLLRQGRVAEAEDLYREIVAHHRTIDGIAGKRLLAETPGLEWSPLWGLALARRAQGDPLESEDLLREFLELSREILGESCPKYEVFLAQYEVLHGNRERALDHLRTAVDGGIGATALVLDRDLVPLQADPAFQELVRTARESVQDLEAAP